MKPQKKIPTRTTAYREESVYKTKRFWLSSSKFECGRDSTLFYIYCRGD